MASAFKCDRCKKLLEGKPMGNVELTQTDEDYGVHFTSDLCEPCFREIHEFLQKKVS